MVWKLREGDEGISVGRTAPDYGSNCEFFTIKMHHSENINYFDYCNEDEISMIEIIEMAKELGLNGTVNFFHNRGGGINDCNNVAIMKHDIDAMALVNFIDGERVAEIYVQHEVLSEDKPENGKNETTGGSFPQVDEPVGYIDLNDSGGSDVQSVGQDSEHSDYIVDSEFFESDDDFNYDQYVDFDGEWGGYGDPQFELGLYFSDAATFRSVVRQHSIVQGRDIKFEKNEKNKVQAICKHKTCLWKIYASQLRNEATFHIKTLNAIHECTRKEKVTCATSKWLANKYSAHIRTNPNWPVDSMMAVVQNDCKLLFSRWQMYRAKTKAKQINTGSSVEQYGLIWRYASEIKGFLDGCRPVIFLDGCHLKSDYGGILLCAVGIDANNGMYPFAYAAVEKEKRESWLWFIDLLKTDLEIGNCGMWTVMSDKQKGLIDAVETLMPNCEHRFCVMHLYSNFKLSHRRLALKNILWNAARASRVVDFERIMRD
ncbi:PREDICTED: uncharacterized protein LOC105954545 [Erythranthe guttata]|uniref:uncharacterized protein LOC105954545 n=1 Tax=Erythranthe guttata TaxID=4155 RepID=UPI00064DAF61|nr:PREDICTED: uncharacterized protein LOC105954545 [Erythranthe guttata]|eukprot:XP_012833671.1 PREDICTED: uncharacterized protein LOC105954545 [Erythranthe guttata]